MYTSRIVWMLLAFAAMITGLHAQENTTPATYSNPILSGFHPDPSICRVGEDYYMVTSSFTWYPGIPIYHSKDLVNWNLIGHGIDRPDQVNLAGLNDNDGIWAVTIRYHEGIFYLITTCNRCGGNFYLTATDPKGPWSNPIWIKDATGIDPSLFWDDDGKCYYTGNSWDFPKSWPSQCAVWMQELDQKQGKLVGERKILAYGHAHNATYAEGPHIYKINGKYLLLMAEGGSDYNHAVTVFQSDKLWGPYVADKVNPVLSHRHLGNGFPIQSLGHADLVQTQDGDWYAVFLGKRMIEGHNPLARETFLSPVVFEGMTPIFNPGKGQVMLEDKRPNLPWTPWESAVTRDEFDSDSLSLYWYSVRLAEKPFYQLGKGLLTIALQPQTVDSLSASAMLLKKIMHHDFQVGTMLDFKTGRDHEEAGLIVYRTANGYYSLTKIKDAIVLTRMHLGKKEVVERIPYRKQMVYLQVVGKGLTAQFSFGESDKQLTPIGDPQKLDVISDNKFNKFNGSGVGVYASSNGKASKAEARYDWFEYKAID